MVSYPHEGQRLPGFPRAELGGRRQHLPQRGHHRGHRDLRGDRDGDGEPADSDHGGDDHAARGLPLGQRRHGTEVPLHGGDGGCGHQRHRDRPERAGTERRHDQRGRHGGGSRPRGGGGERGAQGRRRGGVGLDGGVHQQAGEQLSHHRRRHRGDGDLRPAGDGDGRAAPRALAGLRLQRHDRNQRRGPPCRLQLGQRRDGAGVQVHARGRGRFGRHQRHGGGERAGAQRRHHQDRNRQCDARPYRHRGFRQDRFREGAEDRPGRHRRIPYHRSHRGHRPGRHDRDLRRGRRHPGVGLLRPGNRHYGPGHEHQGRSDHRRHGLYAGRGPCSDPQTHHL